MKYVYTFSAAGTHSTYAFLFRFLPQLKVLKALLCIVLAGSTFSAAKAQISGTVFRDFNGNGTRESTEPLTPGVIIRAYNTNGTLCGSTVSGGTAVTNYTLTGCGTGDVRVEFEIPATGNCVNLVMDYPSPGGAMYGSSVQFVKGNSATVNFGILNPDHFNAGAANTMAYVPCYVHGDPLSTTTTSGDDPWFVGFPYNNSGTTVPSKKLNGRIIGPTWGVAYSKQARKIFTSALVKRHVGLGQLGTGGIYMLTETPTSFSVTNFYDLDANGYRTRADGTTAPAYGSGSSFSFVQPGTTKNSVVYLGATDPLTGQPAGLGVMGTNSQRGLSVSPATPTYDPAAFDQVGKVGLGDLEISDDGVFLFVVNLYSRKLLRMRFDNPENPATFTEILEFNLPSVSVTNGVLRPWALKFYKNKLYVGAVSSGENAGTISNLNAYVFEVTDPTGALTFSNTPVVTYPLTFTRGGATGATCTTWNPWTNNTNSRTRATNSCYPQPILADLEFTDRDDLLLSFIDRAGNQWGDRNYEDLAGPTTQTFFTIAGDIQVAGYNCSTGAYTLENDGRYTSINSETLTGNTTNNQGPGGGEFFFNDSFGGLHLETAQGSMAVLKGEGEVMLTLMDPLGIVSGGTAKFSTTNGTDSDRYQLYSGGLGKAVGLGDLELSAAFAPVEIGNRVWVDANRNGIQDAGEAGIPGAEVRLYDAAKTTLLATAITDANGSYYFTGNTSATGTSGSYVSTTALQPNTEYTLVVVNTGNTGLSVTAITPLTPGETGAVNSGTTTINNDAKADNVGGLQLPCIRLTTGAPGTVSHNYDFGFQCVPQPALVATTSQTVCQGSALILSVDGRPGMTYEWFLGSSTAVISSAVALTTPAINTTTTYRVRGSLLGCTTNESPVILTPAACQTCTVSPATIGGTVFRDFNSDGIDAANDPGIADVSVTIFRCDADGNSAAVTTTTTDLNGNYSFTGLTPGTTYRVEFTNLPAGYNPTYRGTNNGTTAQFVLPGTCNASLGLNQAADFCQNNPPLITPCHVNGGNTAVTPNDALVRFNYDKTGKVSIATTGQIGTTWGTAYARTTRKVYTAAFLKRHSAMGPAGPGAIYITDLTSGTTTTFFNLTAIESVGNVPGNITRGLGTTANPGSPNTDPQAFSLVGTVSLGDIDISEDDQFLYTINLASKKLYRLPVTNPSAGNIVSWDIPAPGCIGGQWRPFALKVAGSKLYVGGICDASTTPVNFTSVASLDAARANLRAVVYEFDPAGGNFTEKLNFPLNFDRGNASALLCTTPVLYEKATHWNPWIDWHKQNGTAIFTDCGINDSYPQPLLSDIETDVDGSLILAFMDRWGHQTGESNNYPDGILGETGTASGDIMRADFNGGNFLLENNGIAGQRVVGGTTAQQTYNSGDNTAPNGQGRGGREFYFGDTWMNTHDERSMGSVALLRGSGEVVMTAMDAANAIYTGGVIWLNNTTGLADDNFTVYSGGIASFGKAYGLGDIEVGCTIAPVQIGNRVFRDDNRNGIQDPCEPPVPGVVVRLYDAAKTTILASVTTNSAGEYYFQSGTVVAGTSTSAVTTTALTYNTAYALVIAGLGTSTVVTSQGLNLTDVSPLTPGESGTLNTGTTVRNNDAKTDLVGGVSLPCIRLTTGGPGENNHTYDFGLAKFICVPPAITALAGSSTLCEGNVVSLSTVVSPAGSYTYVWSAPAGTLTGTNSATASVANLPAGTHTFTVTVSSSPVCSTTATVSVTVNPVPAPTVSNMTVCAGQPAVLTVQNCAGTVQWSANANSATGMSVTVSPMSTATYSVSCSVNGCTGSAMATVTVNELPVINSMSAGVCTGLVASVSVNASAASGNLEYSFNGGAFTPAATFTLTVPSPTTVTVVVRTSGTSCTVSQSLPVNCACQTPATVSVLPANPQTCGLTPVSLTADVTGATSATLSGTGTGSFSQTVISGNTTVFYTPSVADVSAGSVTITVTSADPDGAGACVAVSQRQILTITTIPQPVLSAIPATVCAGSSQTLNANCQTGTVRWSTGATTASITVIVTNTAIYTAVCQSGTACQSSPAGMTVSAAPSPSATASQTILSCVQGQVPDNTTLIAQTNSAAQTGQWTARAGNPNATTFTNALSLTTTVSGLLPGQSYTFVWTNTGGCTAEVTVTTGTCTPQPASLGDYVFADVNRNGIQDSGDMPIAGAVVTLLQNNSAVATTTTNSVGIYSFTGLTPGIPYSVSFSTPPGFTESTTANAGTDDELDSDPVNGVTAPVTLTSGENNLTLDAGFVVTPGVLMVNSPTVCAGNTATLTVAGCTGSVSWNTGVQGASLTIATTGISSATVLSYTATCTTTNTSTFVAGTVTVEPIPVVSVTATRAAGTGSVTLTATGCSGGTVTWSTGATGQQIFVTPSATTLYAATCVTGSGCSAGARIRIGSIPASLDVSVTSALICAGQQITLSATNCGADLVWNTGATGSSISVNPGITTVYSVTCSDDVTTAAASTTITVVPAPAVTLTAGSTIVTAGQPVTLTATGCQSGTLNWSTGAVGVVSQVVSPSMTTTYSVTCVTGPQCSTTANVSVLVSGAPALALNKLVSKQRAQTGEIVNYTLVVSNTGGSAAVNVIIQDSLSSAATLLPASVTASAGAFATGSPNTWTLTSLPAGATATLIYSASIIGEGVVYNTARIRSVPGSETTVCLSVPVKFCTSDVISLQLNAPGGYTSYQWLRNGEVIVSATGSSFTATQIGEYNVLVNQGQCPNGSCCPVVIELDSVPAFTVMPQTPGCEGGQPRNDGRLTIQGLGQNPGLYRYAIAEGTSFTVVNPVQVTIPSNGILAANLTGDRDYTVRVYNAQGCYRDVTVRLVTNCQCPADICVPVLIKKTKSRSAVR